MKKLLLILLCAPLIGLGQNYQAVADDWLKKSSFYYEKGDFETSISAIELCIEWEEKMYEHASPFVLCQEAMIHNSYAVSDKSKSMHYITALSKLDFIIERIDWSEYKSHEALGWACYLRGLVRINIMQFTDFIDESEIKAESQLAFKDIEKACLLAPEEISKEACNTIGK
jgi:hypothetical protein